MRVKINGGKVYLPKGLRVKAGLRDNGVCEAILIGDEIKLRGEIPKTLSIIEAIRKPRAKSSIKDMTRAEEVEASSRF